MRPILEGVAVGRVEPGLVGRPEPAVDVFGLEVTAITAVKVAQTSRGPDVFDTLKYSKNY